MPFYQLKFKYEIFFPATDVLVSFTSPDNTEIITVFKQCVIF